MLRVGLTGGLGSGKSSVARVWAEEGVPVLEADALGRALMQPGQAVYARIAAAFGPAVVRPDGELDRGALAREAFAGGRLQELNAIVHPAVLREQERLLGELERQGRPLAAVESALIFEVSEGARPWRERFDRLVLVTAPEELRAARYAARMAPESGPARARLEEEARRRMGAQLPDEAKRRECDYVIENTRTLVLLRREALAVLRTLREEAGRNPGGRAQPPLP